MRRGHRDAGNGETNQTKSEQQDADQVVVKVAPGGCPGGGVKQGWKNDKEDQIRIEREPRKPGYKAE